jgi:allantoate deiminase
MMFGAHEIKCDNLHAIAIAALCEVGMLFMRCKGGISHNPLETVCIDNIDLALEALEQTIYALSQS